MIRLEQVTQQFPNGTRALRDVTLEVDSQHFTVLIGPSGAGKSTLMRVLNGLIRPTAGRVWIGETEITKASSAQVRLARRQIGMVFQQFNLVKRLTALDNVLLGRLGYRPTWRSLFRAFERSELEFALHLLDRVGMADYAWQRADTLSGGQQQRVGIARALAQRPRLILADEPISALDPKSSEQVMEILRSIHAQDGISVVANLHFLGTVREYAGRVIGLKAGAVMFDGGVSDLTDAAVRDLYYGSAEHEEFRPQLQVA
ncbi:MAG: phosphonate ABC transporter ATP-binding protein [Meiothermus sp.]|nr:phosphonate ABC transporter ATP-binding protein [Meiothermus sp.]